jgi:hypothetical protein
MLILWTPISIQTCKWMKFLQLSLDYFDERILLKLIKETENDSKCHHLLFKFLWNNLYVNDEFDEEKIKKIGGIEPVIKHYLEIRSMKIKENLFIIIYDYVIRILRKKKKIKLQQEKDLLNLLFSSDSHLYLDQIFKFLPENFIERFSRFLFVELVLKERVSDSLDQQTIVSFAFELYDLSSKFLSV